MDNLYAYTGTVLINYAGQQLTRLKNYLNENIHVPVKQRLFVISDIEETRHLEWTQIRLNNAKHQEQKEIV